ncbi:glycoside hydrolase family 2 TIM barrel-domain containing protein, partial [Salmonella enterica]|uniref:glycoside hydrolase family 2 TIM barrel-domain containing protein n=1 Tax=Salmonella enterica TaxID=28901 RepID=UPI003CF6EEA1
DGSKKGLRSLGANSFRTWGADDLDSQLTEAQRLGLTVTIGIWLGHTEQGFRYGDARQVTRQYERAKQAILKYRNHPALLMWGIGNE